MVSNQRPTLTLVNSSGSDERPFCCLCFQKHLDGDEVTCRGNLVSELIICRKALEEITKMDSSAGGLMISRAREALRDIVVK